jgi:hypothetical protein
MKSALSSSTTLAAISGFPSLPCVITGRRTTFFTASARSTWPAEGSYMLGITRFQTS